MSDNQDWNQQVIDDFRATGGQPGGMLEGSDVLLLHTVGAKTGRNLVSPLLYYRKGDRVFIFASANGADRDPAWYHNLLAHPEVRVELGHDTLTLRATPVTGDERDQIYAEQVARAPQFGDYQRKTSRVIPVVALDPA